MAIHSIGIHLARFDAPFPMRLPSRTLILAVAILATAVGVRAADAGKPEVVAAASSSDLQKLIDQFKARRDTLLADRQALIDQLKNATAEQRKQILDKMQAQQKDLIDAQRALGKQIRDEMRKLRESTPGSRH